MLTYLPDGVYAVLRGGVTVGYVRAADAMIAYKRAVELFGKIDHVSSTILVR